MKYSIRPIALVTCDDNPIYTEFIDIVIEAWELLGFECKCLKVGSKEYPQISGIPTSLQAQILRLYAPVQYADNIVIISDIDMVPLNANYFKSNLPTEPLDMVIYSSDAYPFKRYPMCYIASRGINYSVFVKDNESWEEFVRRLYSLDLKWDTDELYMASILEDSPLNLIKLQRGWVNGVASRRLDRVNWTIQDVEYIDAHCPRPVDVHIKDLYSLIRKI
jgi:hypothetical protein